MTKKMKYPMEAFALAAVLFSAGMKEAMIVGIGLIFGDVLQCVLRDFSNKQYMQTISTIGAILTAGAIYLMCVLTGITPDVRQVLGFAVLGLLLVKNQENTLKNNRENNQENNQESNQNNNRESNQNNNQESNQNNNQDNNQDKNKNVLEASQSFVDYNRVLLADACAYGLLVVLAIVREYLAGAEIFGCKLPEIALVSSAYGKAMFALIGAGILIAVINRILKTESDPHAGLWVCIPAILLEVPFVWNNVPEWIGMGVGVVAVGIIYLTLRKKLVFSDTQKHIEGLSVELVMLGIVYMVFSLL